MIKKLYFSYCEQYWSQQLSIISSWFQEKEKPEYAIELKKAEAEYEKTRQKLIQYFGKNFFNSFVTISSHFV